MLGEHQREEALIHLRRGQVLEQANRIEEAAEEYRRALAHDPHLVAARGALGSYYQRHGRLAKAVEEYRVAANLTDDIGSQFTLGHALAGLGRFEEALNCFRRCLELAPDHAFIHHSLAGIYAQRGESEQALRHLRRALPRYNRDWETHALIAECLLRLDEFAAAEASFVEALSLVEREVDRARVTERLTALARRRELGSFAQLKERLYAEHGVALLGSLQDDGLRLDECANYYFTYPDIATTLVRLIATARACAWSFSAVVAADRLAEPVARALAAALELPLLHADLVKDGPALVVLAVGREAELLQLIAEHVHCATATFCLGLNWLRHSPSLPDVTGVIIRGACSVPWEAELRRLRASGAPIGQVEACLDRAHAAITASMLEMAPEPNLERQADFYRRLHFLRLAGQG